MKPPFTTSQEMYNYAASQLINQNLSQETVINNLMEHGVTNADAEIVVQNMMVVIEKNRKAKAGIKEVDEPSAQQASSSEAHQAHAINVYGTFGTLQAMYNYAADQLIVKKLGQQTTKNNLMSNGISATDADEVIKNMMAEIQKKQPVEVNAKRAEGRKMMLVGAVIAGIGLIVYGAKYNIAGQTFAVSYGIMILGGLLFFRGLFKMF